MGVACSTDPESILASWDHFNLLVLDGYSQSAKGVKSFNNNDAKSLNKSQKCIEIFFLLKK